MSEKISEKTYNKLLSDQQDEITAYYLYHKIADFVKDKENKEIVREVAEDELKHYNHLKEITGKELKPERFKIFLFYWITKIFGITFGIKLLERSETEAIASYQEKTDEDVKGIEEIVRDEERHEDELINMIDEDRLNYMGSVVLGLNDALVELTGALAGYTFAFQNTRLIALTGLITGISASFSMAASEYLAKKHEEGQDAVKSSIYTGIAYVFTVVFLILPFLLIFLFNYYISVAKDYNFKKRFGEMAAISLGVAGISFLIGVLIKQFIGVDI